MTKDSSLILYTHPDCSYSTAAKADFDDQGIQYTEKDITLDPDWSSHVCPLIQGSRIHRELDLLAVQKYSKNLLMPQAQ